MTTQNDAQIARSAAKELEGTPVAERARQIAERIEAREREQATRDPGKDRQPTKPRRERDDGRERD